MYATQNLRKRSSPYINVRSRKKNETAVFKLKPAIAAMFSIFCHCTVIHCDAGGVSLVGCFGFNGPLRQYFSLYRAVSQEREKEKRKDR